MKDIKIHIYTGVSVYFDLLLLIEEKSKWTSTSEHQGCRNLKRIKSQGIG